MMMGRVPYFYDDWHVQFLIDGRQHLTGRFAIGHVPGTRLIATFGYKRRPDSVKLFAEIVVQPAVQQRISARLW